MSPEREPIISPAKGVRPMEVSITLPYFTAATLAPLPMWQVMIFCVLMSTPRNSQARFET